MSKRRKKTTNVEKTSVLLSFVFGLVTLVKSNSEYLLKWLSYVLNSLLDYLKMMVADKHISSKKEARMQNKRCKLMAEHRLVVKEHDEEPSNKKTRLDDNKGLSEEEFKKLKKELADRKRMLLQIPRFNLNSTVGVQASVQSTPYNTRTPLLFSDIQHLLTYAYGGNELVPPPSRWCGLQKPNRLAQIIVLVVDGIGLNEFVDNEEHFKNTMEVFSINKDPTNRGIIEFLSPHWYGGTLDTEMSNWSVINKREMPKDPEGFEQVIKQLATVFPIGETNEEQTPPKHDTFPRNSLILTLPQLIQESYPLPIPATSSTREVKHFIPTSNAYKPVGMGSKMFSIDCEMCEAENNSQALTRIAVIDEELNIVYETLVKPKEKIIDYRTRWSGVTKEMIDPIKTNLQDVQIQIQNIVANNPDAIFIGQSLNCDLLSMRMTHPYVIDTSVVFNLTGIEGRKSKLKDLSLNLLDEAIQRTGRNVLGHNPIEDARAAMKLVIMKLSKGFAFGNELKNVNQNNTVMSFDPAIVSTSLKQKKLDKNILVISQTEIPDSESELSAKHKIKHIHANSNRQVVKALKNNCLEHFMSLGFMKINQEILESDASRCLTKFDKRVDKIYSHMLSNSLLVIVCTRHDDKSDNSNTRRNNGVCFIRLKSSEIPRRVDV